MKRFILQIRRIEYLLVIFVLTVFTAACAANNTPITASGPEKEAEKEAEKESSEKEKPETADETEREEEMMETAEEERKDFYYAYGLLSDQEKVTYDLIFSSLYSREAVEIPGVESQEKLSGIYRNVIADHPELFYVEGYQSVPLADGKTVTFEGMFSVSKEEIEEQIKELEEKLGEASAVVDAQSGEFEKAKAAFEYVVRNARFYGKRANGQSAYSALVTGKAVCTGYAAAAELILQKAGIQSVLVTGYAVGQDHAWLMVMIEGKWYYMDPSWADSPPQAIPEALKDDYINYTYFLMTREEARREHVPDEALVLPEESGENGLYFKRTGRYFETADPEQLADVIREAEKNGEKLFQIRAEEGAFRELKRLLHGAADNSPESEEVSPALRECLDRTDFVINTAMRTITIFFEQNAQ